MAASCKEDIEPSTPQHNPQEPILNAAQDISAELTGALAEATAQENPTVLNLQAYNEPEATIPVFKLTKAENLPAGSEVVYKLQISDTEDFAKSATLVPTLADDIYSIDAAKWNEAQMEVFGKTDKVVDVYYRVPAYVSLEGTEYRISDSDTSADWYAFSGKFQEKRMDFSYTLAQNYYAMGTANGAEFTHGDGDVYDNPNFTFTFEVTEAQAAGAGYSILVRPDNEADHAKWYGFDAENNTLVEGGNALVVKNAGPYKLDINVEKLTYSLKVAPKSLFIPTTGAVFNAKTSEIPTSDFISYAGLAFINNRFRITGQKGWNPTQYGAASSDEVRADEGSIVNGSLNWIYAADEKASGLYWVDINLVKLSYKIQYIKTLGVVGGFNNWGNENPDKTVTPDAALTPKDNYTVWTGEFTVAEASETAPCEYKIRANEDWAISFGYTDTPSVPNETVFNAGNYKVTEPGTYAVEFKCGSYPYTLTVTKK